MNFQPVGLDGIFRGWADGCNLHLLQASVGIALFLEPIPYCLDSVHAGQYQPVVACDVFQSGVQPLVGSRRANFDEWNLNDFGAEFAQAGRERARLMAGAPDQNTETG